MVLAVLYLKILIEVNANGLVSSQRPITNFFTGEYIHMRGWRSKLIFVLIIFFAGFATGIYCLAPVPEAQAAVAEEKGFVYSAFKSDEFAQSFNVKMHRCLDYAKDTTCKAGSYLKQKWDER